MDGEFHIISAVDFDDFMKTAFSDAIEVQSRVREGGRYYLAFDLYDLIFDRNGLIENCIHEKWSTEINQFIESLNNYNIRS